MARKKTHKLIDLRILALGAVILFALFASGLPTENLGASIPGGGGMAPVDSAPIQNSSTSASTPSSSESTGTSAGSAEGTPLEKAAAAGLPVASSPSDCGTRDNVKINNKKVSMTPVNCLFLEEPIGGRVGYDLYVDTCTEVKDKEDVCKKTRWSGGSINKNQRGPIQAVLTGNLDRPYEGPFGLLYGYLSLVYGYMSGIIVGMAVLFVVIGGIQMTTSAGDAGRFDAGKSRITRAIVGLILWFTASLILYTINPTFFAF